MPGFLIPNDLGRMIPPDTNPFAWAEQNLLASPGALVATPDLGVFRIPTLVPRVKADGSCIHLKDDRCMIHAVAPFGCAFFDCSFEDQRPYTRPGLIQIIDAHAERKLYGQLWEYLNERGLCQFAPEQLRRRYQV